MPAKWLKLLLACVIWFGFAENGTAFAAGEPRQAVVLFVEGLSFQDLARLRSYPHVNKWLRSAEVGAMSIRIPGSRTAANAYLLMGSGGQALYSERSGTAYHPEEHLPSGKTAGMRAAELHSDEGRDLADSRILFPGIFRLIAENRDKPYTERIGLLGETLARHGIPVASYGNGDYDGEKQRNAVLFTMDRRGSVPLGDLSTQTSAVSGYPYGVRTDYDYLLKRLREDRTTGLIAVQLSDLARLYQLADDMEPARFAEQYERILSDLDEFLGEVLRQRTRQQMVMLISPAVNPRAQQEKSLLTPIAVWRQGESGQLTSATTRQPGLVSGLDVLPTIMSWLSVPVPSGVVGHAMMTEAGTDLDQLFASVAQIDHLYRNRSPVLYTYVMMQIVILIAAALLWMWRKNGETVLRMRRGVSLALVSMLCFPGLFLAEAMLGWKAAPSVVLGVLIMAAFSVAVWAANRPFLQMLFLVSGATVAGLLLDGFTGAEAIRRSYLGYDPVIGARFYGLGNEYEGVLIGASILFVSALYQRRSEANGAAARPDWLSTAAALSVFGTVLFYMASPVLGANAGGFLSGLVGFSVAFVRLQGWRPGKKGLLLLAGGVLAGILVLIVSSLYSRYPLTHIGRVAQEIVSGNWTEVANIVERKLEMNLRLIRISVWSKVFAISLVVIGLLSLRSDRYLRHLAAAFPRLAKGLQGVIAGSLAGLLLNDSGIITAATSIVFLVVPALFAALGEKANERCST